MAGESEITPLIGERAAEMIEDDSVVGLGTGHAATEFLHALGKRVQAGMHVRGIPTSRASADLAQQLGIPLTTFDEVDSIDVDFDGADEVDPQCNLIKGYGGALVREKIVAAASKRLVILIGGEKLVPVLGTRGKLPVEVIPFGLRLCTRSLQLLDCIPHLRMHGNQPFVTDNGNYILDCQVKPLSQPAALEQAILAIPGVVGTGLFLNMAHTVLIEHEKHIEMRQRSEA